MGLANPWISFLSITGRFRLEAVATNTERAPCRPGRRSDRPDDIYCKVYKEYMNVYIYRNVELVICIYHQFVHSSDSMPAGYPAGPKHTVFVFSFLTVPYCASRATLVSWWLPAFRSKDGKTASGQTTQGGFDHKRPQPPKALHQKPAVKESKASSSTSHIDLTVEGTPGTASGQDMTPDVVMKEIDTLTKRCQTMNQDIHPSVPGLKIFTIILSLRPMGFPMGFLISHGISHGISHTQF